MGILVSFVVIAYNEAGNIGRTLDGITAQAGLAQQRYEVIVVNDGSRDRTADIVADRAARNPRINLIDLPANRGRGHARATGILAAQGELIATVDADIILPADWLLRAEAALAGCDAVGGTAVPDGDVAYVFQATKLVPRVVGHTTAVTGSNALYRRQVFDLVAFDPSLREGEDSAFNQATARHGLSFGTVPGLLVQHTESKTLPDSLRWLFNIGRGATRQLLVYRQVRTPDVVTGAFLSSLVAGTVVGVLADPLVGAGIPVVVLLAVSVQHVRSRFETPLVRLPSVSLAVALDGAHLLAYFAGRVAGLSWLSARRKQPVGSLGDRRDVDAALAGGGQGVAEQCQSVATADDPVMEGDH
jgi:Glycosyl transferase family 2